MPRTRWIDKNSAQTYQLLYRSQDDPLLHSETAGDRALFQVSGPASTSTSKILPQHGGLHLAELEEEMDLQSMRDNEGEAAEYGIYFDDSNYDYMAHLKDIGEGGAESHFVDAASVTVQGKGKGTAKPMKLEDALREISLDDEPSIRAASVLNDEFSTFSRTKREKTYQNQQDVPDEIAGFQPDMDHRLREVLEALEDDAYVDDKDEDDIFGALAKDGQSGELDLDEFEMMGDDDDGWESDATEKAHNQSKQLEMPSGIPNQANGDEAAEMDAQAAAAEDGEWLRDFAKFKREAAKKPVQKATESVAAASGVQDQAPSLYTLNGTPLRQKKRKGAMTNPSAYSMTSSSLARTEGQQLLDARFDQVEKMYALDETEELDDMDGEMSLASGMTGASKMSQLSTTSFADAGAVRTDFDGMMDGFLGDWNKANPGGKRKGAKGKRGKNGNEKYGLQQLDEVRAELGPARLYRRSQKT